MTRGYDDDPRARELATGSIVVKIRWFGIAMGVALALSRPGVRDPSAVCAFLALGAGFAGLDTAFHRMGEVFLGRWPLFVSAMEATFIALLCYHDSGLDSPFRWYYLLSLVCCAIRYRQAVAWATLVMHCASLGLLAAALGAWPSAMGELALWGVILAWVTWSSASLAGLLRATGERLGRANAELSRSRDELEVRVAERTADLRAAQGREIQKEKMAAFGLLAAGIAHEVGNPLASLSSLVQLLQRRGPDAYTATKLDLAAQQLDRIRRTLRELVDFSRPASTAEGLVRLAEVVDEALAVAKYYPRTKARRIVVDVPADLPPVRAVRDHLTQVVLNLLFNAIDATGAGGRIEVSARAAGETVELEVTDDGPGIAAADRDRLFQPHFTTKPSGTGLGLFVCRQIAAECGGTIVCATEEGCGTAFTVRLPSQCARRAADCAWADGECVGCAAAGAPR